MVVIFEGVGSTIDDVTLGKWQPAALTGGERNYRYVVCNF